MGDMTKSHVVEKKRKPVHHQRWFWAVVIAFMALSLYGGIRSSRANVGDATPIVETPHRWSDLTQGNASPIKADRDHVASQRLAEINNLIPGLISRLYVEERLLYVNESIWKVISSGRKAFITRAIAEYLDWYHGTSTGLVYVRSFRDGGPLKVTE